MAAERTQKDRELRLEGPGLFVVVGALLVLIVGAFYLGRYVEHRKLASRVVDVADGPGPLSRVVTPTEVETDSGGDFFDDATVPEPGRELPGEPEPSPARSATRQQPDDPAPAKTAKAAAPVTAAEPFYVQVFAGRDRSAAEQVVGHLKTEGYAVRLFSDRGNGGALVRVRVGGFPDERKARLTAADLRKSGYADAFVTRVE